jgi:hypothetical protein
MTQGNWRGNIFEAFSDNFSVDVPFLWWQYIYQWLMTRCGFGRKL